MSSLRTLLFRQILRDLLPTRRAALRTWATCQRCMHDCLVDFSELTRIHGRAASFWHPQVVLRCDVCRGQLQPLAKTVAPLATTAAESCPTPSVIDLAAYRRRRLASDGKVQRPQPRHQNHRR